MRQNIMNTIDMARTLFRLRFKWENPIYLIHAITARCNARCGFCAWHPDFYDGSDELTTDEVKKLYRDAREAGFVALSLWGGEPLVRQDVGELLKYAKELGFATNMITNGALLERKMDEVVPHIDRLCISVDYPSDKHDSFRGVKGLYGKILSATLRIKAKYPKQKIVYNYTIQNENADLQIIEEMARVMKTLGVAGIFNGMRIEAASTDEEKEAEMRKYNPTNAKLAEVFEKLRELKKLGYPIVNSHTHINKMTDLPMFYRCHWPKAVLPIEANGDVVDCQYWGRKPIDNIRNKPFSEILKHPRVLALAGKEGESCHKCVSVHRIDVSEAWEGRLRALASWGRNLA